MTAAARLALDDCRQCLRMLRVEPEGPSWRVIWVATIALLRAVGHVLAKADAPKDVALQRIVDAKWEAMKASKPAPAIFWEFIESERNDLLKTYETAARTSVAVGGGKLGRPNSYDYRIGSGIFAGRDQREVVEEAIAFWDEYLLDIENTYRTANP